MGDGLQGWYRRFKSGAARVDDPIRGGDSLYWDMSVDVAVVGFGGAGAAAAIEARDQGVDVAVIERFNGGGSTKISGGIYYAGGGTAIQQEAGVEDSPENMKKKAEELGYTFPYLYDETQAVAKSYDAACTPDFYVFDKNLALAYRGRLDESRPGSGIPLTGNDLRSALDSVLKGEKLADTQYPSMGCNIKWKK